MEELEMPNVLEGLSNSNSMSSFCTVGSSDGQESLSGLEQDNNIQKPDSASCFKELKEKIVSTSMLIMRYHEIRRLNDELTRKNQQMEEHNKALEGSSKILETELNVCLEEIEPLMKANKKLKLQYKQQELKITKLKDELESAVAMGKQYQDMNSKVQSDEKTTKKDMQDLKSSNAKLQEENNKCNKLIKKHKDEVKSLQAKVRTLQRQLKRKQHTGDTKRAEKDRIVAFESMLKMHGHWKPAEQLLAAFRAGREREAEQTTKDKRGVKRPRTSMELEESSEAECNEDRLLEDKILAYEGILMKHGIWKKAKMYEEDLVKGRELESEESSDMSISDEKNTILKGLGANSSTVPIVTNGEEEKSDVDMSVKDDEDESEIDRVVNVEKSEKLSSKEDNATTAALKDCNKDNKGVDDTANSIENSSMDMAEDDVSCMDDSAGLAGDSASILGDNHSSSNDSSEDIDQMLCDMLLEPIGPALSPMPASPSPPSPSPPSCPATPEIPPTMEAASPPLSKMPTLLPTPAKICASTPQTHTMLNAVRRSSHRASGHKSSAETSKQKSEPASMLSASPCGNSSDSKKLSSEPAASVSPAKDKMSEPPGEKFTDLAELNTLVSISDAAASVDDCDIDMADVPFLNNNGTGKCNADFAKPDPPLRRRRSLRLSKSSTSASDLSDVEPVKTPKKNSVKETKDPSLQNVAGQSFGNATVDAKTEGKRQSKKKKFMSKALIDSSSDEEEVIKANPVSCMKTCRKSTELTTSEVLSQRQKKPIAALKNDVAVVTAEGSVTLTEANKSAGQFAECSSKSASVVRTNLTDKIEQPRTRARTRSRTTSSTSGTSSGVEDEVKVAQEKKDVNTKCCTDNVTTKQQDVMRKDCYAKWKKPEKAHSLPDVTSAVQKQIVSDLITMSSDESTGKVSGTATRKRGVKSQATVPPPPPKRTTLGNQLRILKKITSKNKIPTIASQNAAAKQSKVLYTEPKRRPVKRSAKSAPIVDVENDLKLEEENKQGCKESPIKSTPHSQHVQLQAQSTSPQAQHTSQALPVPLSKHHASPPMDHALAVEQHAPPNSHKPPAGAQPVTYPIQHPSHSLHQSPPAAQSVPHAPPARTQASLDDQKPSVPTAATRQVKTESSQPPLQQLPQHSMFVQPPGGVRGIQQQHPPSRLIWTNILPPQMKMIEEELMKLHCCPPGAVLAAILNRCCPHPQVIIDIVVKICLRKGDDFLSDLKSRIPQQATVSQLHAWQPYLASHEQEFCNFIHLLHYEQKLVNVAALFCRTTYLFVCTDPKIPVVKRSSLCRLATAVCRRLGLYSAVRVHIYDMMMHSGSGYPVLLLAVASVWPSLLLRHPNASTDYQPMLRVLEYAVMKKSLKEKPHHRQMSDCYSSLCWWNGLGEDSSTIAQRLLDTMSKATTVTAEFHECEKALLLLANLEDWEWINNTLITELIFPYLQKWAQLKKEKDVKDTGNEIMVASLVKCLGLICRHCSPDLRETLGGVHSIMEAFAIGPLKICQDYLRELALESLLLLAPYDADRVAKCCQQCLQNEEVKLMNGRIRPMLTVFYQTYKHKISAFTPELWKMYEDPAAPAAPAAPFAAAV